jgi:hypothetical protein
MSKTSRRKKAKPVKNRRMTFRISVEAQPVVVRYQSNSMDDMAHFEFRSPYRPARRIPISESGYYSHFAWKEDVKAAKTPQRYASQAALALLPWRRTVKATDSAELPLF